MIRYCARSKRTAVSQAVRCVLICLGSRSKQLVRNVRPAAVYRSKDIGRSRAEENSFTLGT